MSSKAPTLDEIRRVCLEIQAEWSESERQKRIANDREQPVPWTVPVWPLACDVVVV